jgi:hypothetical protein
MLKGFTCKLSTAYKMILSYEFNYKTAERKAEMVSPCPGLLSFVPLFGVELHCE